MLKQIEISGQRFELYSLDGRTWSSSPRSIVAYRRRKKMARLELQKRFELIGDIQDPDPNNYRELEIPKSLIGRQVRPARQLPSSARTAQIKDILKTARFDRK